MCTGMCVCVCVKMSIMSASVGGRDGMRALVGVHAYYYYVMSNLPTE